MPPRLGVLGDERLRQVTLGKLHVFNVEEITRRLDMIRKTWLAEPDE